MECNGTTCGWEGNATLRLVDAFAVHVFGILQRRGGAPLERGVGRAGGTLSFSRYTSSRRPLVRWITPQMGMVPV